VRCAELLKILEFFGFGFHAFPIPGCVHYAVGINSIYLVSFFFVELRIVLQCQLLQLGMNVVLLRLKVTKDNFPVMLYDDESGKRRNCNTIARFPFHYEEIHSAFY